MSNLNPSSVICEVMNEDGRMARLDDLIKFSKKHNIKIASIADIISYRFKNEKLVYKSSFKNLFVNKSSNTQISIFKNKLNDNEIIVNSKGKFRVNKSIPVRVISKTINKKNLLRNKEIKKNIKILSRFKNYLLVIINNKIKKEKENSDLTLRYYGIGAQIIKDFKVKI